MTTYTIAADDAVADTLFYVSRNRWSPEYPDAYKFETKQSAHDHLKNIQRMNPDNEKYRRAYVR